MRSPCCISFQRDLQMPVRMWIIDGDVLHGTGYGIKENHTDMHACMKITYRLVAVRPIENERPGRERVSVGGVRLFEPPRSMHDAEVVEDHKQHIHRPGWRRWRRWRWRRGRCWPRWTRWGRFRDAFVSRHCTAVRRVFQNPDGVITPVTLMDVRTLLRV